MPSNEHLYKLHNDNSHYEYRNFGHSRTDMNRNASTGRYRSYCKPNPTAEEDYRREARAAAEARRRGNADSSPHKSRLEQKTSMGARHNHGRSQDDQLPKNRFESALLDRKNAVKERTDIARSKAYKRYDELDKGLGGIVSTKVVLIVLAALLLFAILSVGVRFVTGLAKPSGSLVNDVATQVLSRADSCKLSEKDVAARLEAVGVEETWADKAATLSQSDARFQTMAQLSSSLGREGTEVTNKIVKLAVSDPEAIDYVVGFITKYPQDAYEAYTETVNKGTVPLLYQWDPRWGYIEYSGTTFGCTGCGPTTLSMVYMGVTGSNDMSPGDMAKLANEHGYETDNEGTMNQFFVEEAAGLGMQVDVLDVETEALTDALKDGKVIICNVGPGDFTDYGHFIVISGLTSDGDLKINDPFSSVNSAKNWDPDEVVEQTVALYAYSEA